MANVVLRILRSSQPGKEPTPSQLKEGRLAINIATGKLYTLDSSGDVICIGSSDAISRALKAALSVNGIFPNQYGDVTLKVSDLENDAGYLTEAAASIRKDIELPDNGSPKRQGGLFDFTYQKQVDNLALPYIPGKCIFEFPNAQQNRKTLWAIAPKKTTRNGTRILPLSGILTFTESTPALIAGCLFDYVETTANGISRFRFIGDHPMYVHMKGTLRMHKKLANQAQTSWNLSDATLRLNPVNSSNVPQEARNNVSGGQYIAYSPCMLAPTGMQPQQELGGGIEFNDPSYRWRKINEESHKDGDDWDQSLITYLDGVYIEGGEIHPDDGESEPEQEGDPEISEGLPGALTAKFDVSQVLPGRYVRVYVDNPELEAQGGRGVSTRFRVLFRDADGNTMRRDDRQYLSATADARVIRVPEGAKDCYLYFKRPIDTANRVRVAKVLSTISQVTFDPGYGVWGEYIFDIDRGITLYPGTVYDFNLVMGSKSGFLSGVFEDNVLRYMGGSISFDFNAYPYLKKKGILL